MQKIALYLVHGVKVSCPSSAPPVTSPLADILAAVVPAPP